MKTAVRCGGSLTVALLPLVERLYDTSEAEKKIHLMTDFCRMKQVDYVPDPYYGGASGFENVLDILEDACEGLLDEIRKGHSMG